MRPVSLAVTAFVLVAALAGCLSSDDAASNGDTDGGDGQAPTPFSTFLCTDGQHALREGDIDVCNHRVTKPMIDGGLFDWTSQHGPANEVSIAVDPTNPMRLIAGGKDYTVSYISDRADCGEYTVWMGAYWSTDGGLTWGNDMIPGFPGDPRPSPLRGNICNTDPVMAFDDDGTAWYHALNYDGGRDDASTLPSPMGGHDLASGSQLYFARSDDGGATYDGSDITFAAVGDDGVLFNDKNWFALQPGGDHMMATWSAFVPAGDGIFFVESHDNGQTWSPMTPITTGPATSAPSVQFSMPQYLPGGDRLAVIWGTSNAVGGGDWTLAYTEGTITPAGTVFVPPTEAFTMNSLKSGSGRDGTGPSQFRLSTYPVLAVDTSGGACDGRRYVTWPDQPGPLDSDVEVLLRWSDDGQTWSDARTIATDSAGDQLMPWIDVGPDGGVHAVWYDRRHDPENRLLDVYYGYSGDCGETWSNLRVTETSFDGDLGHHQNGSPFIGDYIGVDSTATTASIVWADTRHTGTPGRMAGSDVYAATLVRDAAAGAALTD